MFGRKPSTPEVKISETDAARFKAMEDAIAAMSGAVTQLATQSRSTQTLLARLATQRGEPQQRQESREPLSGALPQLPKVKLPNPADDPDGFSQALIQQVSAAAQNTVAGALAKQHDSDYAASAAAEERAQFWAGLDEEFEERFTDLKGKDKAVKSAAEKVIKRLQRRRVDVEQYAMADPDAWLEEVAQEARGAVKAAEEAARAKQPQQADPAMFNGEIPHGHVLGEPLPGEPGAAEPDPFRAMVTGTGAANHGAPRKPQTHQPGSMIADIQAEQKRLRLL